MANSVKKKSSKKKATSTTKKKTKKVDWNKLEIDFYKSDLSLSKFLESNGISPKSGNTQRLTKGWVDNRRQISEKIKKKTTDKFIQKQSTINANNLVKSTDVAQMLLNRIAAQINSSNYITPQNIVFYSNANAKCGNEIRDNKSDDRSITKQSSLRSGLIALNIEHNDEVEND